VMAYYNLPVPDGGLLHAKKFGVENMIRYNLKNIDEVERGFLFTTFEAVFLRIALFNYDYDIHFPLNRSYF